MTIQPVKEGKIRIKILPGKVHEAAVFFNPEAEFQRDISVSALQVWANKNRPKTALDALSATGIRGLRYAKEVKGIGSVILNDKNPLAVKLIKNNIRLNSCKKCKASHEDANVLMRENVFQVIDIDPFGPPVNFLDSAARSIFHKGFLAVTATDTAPLCGTYPAACFRKYGIKTIKGTDYYLELGLRILISHIMLTFARWDRAFVPVLSHTTMHYFRTYGRMGRASEIEALLRQFGFVCHCPKCGNRSFGRSETTCDMCGSQFQMAGPLYLGPISDKRFCEETLSDLSDRKFKQKIGEMKLLNLLIEEAELPPFYYDVHYVAKKQKLNIPKTGILMEKLKSRGFSVGRTHFCDTAVKTNAGFAEFLEILKS
jgi:tRNA (guanine26-N2/guanine27-N2)-dimethyltransferase